MRKKTKASNVDEGPAVATVGVAALDDGVPTSVCCLGTARAEFKCMIVVSALIIALFPDRVVRT